MTNSINRLYLLPYGGGSASSFRSYIQKISGNFEQVVPLELAGRGARRFEAQAETIQECAQQALQQIDYSDGDYVLHGHCMGALLAFEAVKLLQEQGAQLPLFMVVSGRNAPRHANDWLRRVAPMDDQELFSELRTLGAVPKGLNFAMGQSFLSKIRGDHAMFSNYTPGDTRIAIPVLALAGKNDMMTNPDGLADWQDYCSSQVSVKWLEGAHYFILEQPATVAQIISDFNATLNAHASSKLLNAGSRRA